MKLFFLLVTLVLPGESKPLDTNILSIPMPTKALCNYMIQELVVVKQTNDFSYAVKCIEIDDPSESF